MELLNDETKAYVRKLISGVPGIHQVWLIGSRANGVAREDSDWDLVVFLDPASIERIESDTSLHADRVDLLVVASDGTFRRPWGSSRSGSLSTWEWTCITPTQARYVGTKWIPDKEAAENGIDTLGYLQRDVLNARLVWDCDRPLSNSVNSDARFTRAGYTVR
jgi:predicted nucleotidyltransferase